MNQPGRGDRFAHLLEHSKGLGGEAVPQLSQRLAAVKAKAPHVYDGPWLADVPWLVEQVERLQKEAIVAAAERGLLRRAEAEVERLREQAVRLRDLLRAVTIDEMGGVPDLAWPRGDEFRDGDSDPWDLWDAAAKEALADE